VRTKHVSSVLLSILLVTSLMVPLLTFTVLTSVGTVKASSSTTLFSDNFDTATDNALQYDSWSGGNTAWQKLSNNYGGPKQGLGRLGLLESGSSLNPWIESPSFATAGYYSIQISFVWTMELDYADKVCNFVAQWSTDEITWTDIAGTTYVKETDGNQKIISNVSVGSDDDVGNKSALWIRWYNYLNYGSGTRDKVSFDNVVITGSQISGEAVSVSISPSSQGGENGAMLTYTVVTKNVGTISDNYILTVSDSKNWSPTLDNNTFLNVGPGENGTTTLRVTVPVDAEDGADDPITVTATSLENENTKNNGTCNAICDIPFTGSPENFTIVALPDTQYYSQNYPSIFDNQTNWIVQNENAQNIVFVAHLGDIVNDYYVNSEWQHADASMRILDNKVLYGILPGNHDLGDGGATYETYFPPSRYSYWDGSYVSYDNNLNNYQLFSAYGMNFIVLDLEYNPPQDVLNWAGDVLDNYWDRRAIISTHSYYTYAGNLSDTGGTNIWYSLVLPHNNVFLVLCGHSYNSNTGIGEFEKIDNLGDRTVYQLLSDYQCLRNPNDGKVCGNGYLRIMTFVPSENKIFVKTYSPWLDNYMTGYSSQFKLTYPMEATPITVSISPRDNHADNGKTATFIVTVTNHENFPDNFILTVYDNSSLNWGPFLSENSLNIPDNAADNTVILSVPVPSDAVVGTRDKVTVTATSKTDNSVSGSGSCIAEASLAREVQITIETNPLQGSTGDNLVCTIVVKNIGVVADNYKLTLSENLGWLHGWNAPSQVANYQTSSSKLYPTDDSMVQEGLPDNNNGTRYNMYVGWIAENYKTEWSYLKFNLSSIPSGRRIDNAFLWLNTWYGPSHPPGNTPDNMWIEAWNVDNDNWTENTITWNYKPAMGTTLLDNTYIRAYTWVGTLKWYSWNATSFVASQYAGDNKVSIGMRSTTSESRQDNNTLWFFTKDNDATHNPSGIYNPYLQVAYSENIGILENSVSLDPGENWTGQFWVVVGGDPGTTDNLTFTATSLIDNTITTSAIGQAQSVLYPFDVKVSISPNENHAENGQQVTFTVTVKNNGINTDNYDLTVIDNDNWRPTLDDNRFENVLSGQSRTTTLRVTIPNDATPGTFDNIIVTAASQNQSELKKGASCVAGFSSTIVNALNLAAGWNLVHFPVASAGDTPDNILDGQTYYMWRWSAENKKYVSPSTSAPVELGIGYWIWVGYGQTVTTSDVPVDTYSENLKNGWNLVGFPVTSDNTTPDNLFLGQTYYMWRWSAENKKYVSPPSDQPVELGVGYWIWVDHDQTITAPL
jgi:uncharacterized membrane protein